MEQTMIITHEDYVSSTEAARLLGVCPVTLWRWIKKAEQSGQWYPTAIPVAQARYWRKDEILAFGTIAGRR
jgi:transposase-like protein